jgi:hypothetical protein
MVRQLHPPPRTRGEHNQDLTIIFFCGSTNEPSGWKNTWIQRGDPEVCWPRDWLPKAVEKWGLRRGMLVLSVSYLGGPGSFCDKMENIVSHLVEILPNRCYALLWLPLIYFFVVWLEFIVLMLPLMVFASHLGLCFSHNCVLRFPHRTLEWTR